MKVSEKQQCFIDKSGIRMRSVRKLVRHVCACLTFTYPAASCSRSLTNILVFAEGL
ncbi:hypothetical protein Pfo_025745, partial [Paulownia fortunei]